MKEEEVVVADIDDVSPSPQYNVLSDNLRRCAPSGLQCTVFCGGRNCKYETPESWDSAHMAIRGIYSHWVTDDILAMARPCTEIINKRNVIKQFQSLGVRSLLNLQEPWEHNYCGCPLEPSGFTYDPAIFMDNGIYYYNYAWQDYGEVKVTRILDMVKIMCHGLSEGRLAIHCHAGLGRTGVLIACFLVYNMRFRANEAIRFVRLKRPNSVQSRGQILCVQNFERYIWPYNVVFSKKLLLKQPKIPEVTLPHYILTQKIMLHGFEARCIQHIPKIMYVVCERLLQLCGCDPVATIPIDHHAPTTMHFLAANKNPSHYHHIKNLLNICSKMKATNQHESSSTDTKNRKKTTHSPQPAHENTKLEEENENGPQLKSFEDEPNNNIQSESVEGEHGVGQQNSMVEENSSCQPELLTEETESRDKIKLLAEETDYDRPELLAEKNENTEEDEVRTVEFEDHAQLKSLEENTDDNSQQKIMTDENGQSKRLVEDAEKNVQLDTCNVHEIAPDSSNENENDTDAEGKFEHLTYLGCGDMNRTDFTTHDVVEAMTQDLEDMSDAQRRCIMQYQLNLTHGESCWRSLQSESRLAVLAGLLTDWMEQLKNPIVDCELLCQIIIHAEDPLACLQKFDFVTQYTIEYLFRFVAHLTPINNEDLTCLVQRLVASLTQQSVLIRGNLLPKEKDFCKLRKGTYRKAMEFSMNLLDQIKKNIVKNNLPQRY